MSNEEKAYEISQSPLIEDGIWHYATAEIAAIEMAEWKDQQFKEYGKFLQWIHDRLEFVYHENPNMDFMRKFQLIINELFGK